MRLNKKEIEFIRLACVIHDGVLDYEQDDNSFKVAYGLTPNKAADMIEKLQIKCENELDKLELKNIKSR